MEKSTSLVEDDLKFFGAVSASISHEMKNVLAIINEMMGLLDDLSRQANAGRPLDPGRLQQIAGRMKAQIERGNGIMRDLNRFAHTVDCDADILDLGDMTAFVCALARRRAALRNVDLRVNSAQPVNANVSPFALAHLIWECLQHCAALTAPGAVLEITVTPPSPPRGPAVRFVPGTAVPEGTSPTGCDACGRMASRLNAAVNYGDNGGIDLELQ